MEALLPMILVVQGVMGGIDTLLFLGLGWFAWHGAATLAIAALLVAEVAITACDELVENRIRVLPPC